MSLSSTSRDMNIYRIFPVIEVSYLSRAVRSSSSIFRGQYCFVSRSRAASIG